MKSPILQMMKEQQIAFIMLKERDTEALDMFVKSMDTSIWVDALPDANARLVNQIVLSEMISRLDQEMLVQLIVHAVNNSRDHRMSIAVKAITLTDTDFIAVVSLDDQETAYGFLYIPDTDGDDFAALYTVDASNEVH